MEMHGPPVTVTITGSSAALAARLVEVTGTDGGAVIMRALGLLELALKAERDGKRVAFYDPESLEFSDVVF